MRKFAISTFRILPLLVCTVALALASCGTDSRHFKIDGRLLNINQGEFYVYSMQGGTKGIDTIKVQAGRFSYSMECTSPQTLLIVFPNFTEQPVFAEPGKSVDIKGDASHLKEMTVKGTEDNELMNKFREQVKSASPQEMTKAAKQFAEDHPESAVSVYLVRRFFIACDKPDLRTAATLLARLSAAQPDNAYLRTLHGMVQNRVVLAAGSTVPQFKTTAVDGSFISSTELAASPATVFIAWASWNPESVNMLRTAVQRERESGGRVKVVGICLDASASACIKSLQQNKINARCVCDGRMVEGSLYNKLGMSSIPDNVVIKNGRVSAASLNFGNLMNALAE